MTGKAVELATGNWFLSPLPPVILNLRFALLPWEWKGWKRVWVEWKWPWHMTGEGLLSPRVPGLTTGNSRECPLPVSYSLGLAANTLQQ